ncbi:GxxExxY protein [Flavobacterium bomense]|uniref:GxxExxY protein n=1 Tax=Flavobacterium bomense TaxID=2497483 RepID=A0A432CNU6_9FLAO|nr:MULTISPECIES: GxxExxY protein [Flavobacterium]RTY66302.1 GxxExxY protein [Flavobacterium sp. LB2P53]RTZ05651.1 GxxExxY protein [Flavobacterium bomense]
MEENDITYKIRGCIFLVYKNLGPGLLESVYEAALLYELKKHNLEVKSQVVLPVLYDGINLEIGFRLDILVEEKVIIEIKSVKDLCKLHFKQLLTYLKLSRKKVGILVNFNCENITENIKRIVNDF